MCFPGLNCGRLSVARVTPAPKTRRNVPFYDSCGTVHRRRFKHPWTHLCRPRRVSTAITNTPLISSLPSEMVPFQVFIFTPSVGALQLACTLTVFMLPIFSFSSNVSSSLSFVVSKISRHAGFWKQTRQSGKMKTTITATGVPQRRRSDAFPLPSYLRMSQLIEWKWRAGAIADLL